MEYMKITGIKKFLTIHGTNHLFQLWSNKRFAKRKCKLCSACSLTTQKINEYLLLQKKMLFDTIQRADVVSTKHLPSGYS